MERSGNVNESEMECENGDNPTVDASGRCDVGICEHTLDILSVNLDDEVATTDEVESESTDCSVKAVELELRLGESSFAIV